MGDWYDRMKQDLDAEVQAKIDLEIQRKAAKAAQEAAERQRWSKIEQQEYSRLFHIYDRLDVANKLAAIYRHKISPHSQYRSGISNVGAGYHHQCHLDEFGHTADRDTYVALCMVQSIWVQYPPHDYEINVRHESSSPPRMDSSRVYFTRSTVHDSGHIGDLLTVVLQAYIGTALEFKNLPTP